MLDNSSTKRLREAMQAIIKSKAHGFVPGVIVRRANLNLNDTVYNDTGIITGFNNSLYGDFPAHQYPLKARFKNGTFEFHYYHLEIVEGQ